MDPYLKISQLERQVASHGPTIAALAERLAVAEERVRTLDAGLQDIKALSTVAAISAGPIELRGTCIEIRNIATAAIDTARAGEGK